MGLNKQIKKLIGKKIEKKFKAFFKKHPNITSLPWVLVHYRSSFLPFIGETSAVLEYDEHCEKIQPSVPLEEVNDFWENIMEDVPRISEKSLLFLFNESCLLVVHNKKGKVEIQKIIEGE